MLSSNAVSTNKQGAPSIVREPKRWARLGCLWMMVMTTGSMGEPGSHKPVRAPTADTSVKFTQAQYIEYQTELDGYSRSAGLAELKDGQPDQLRMWITGAIILPEPDDVDGYVVTKGQTSICRAKSPISETSDSIQRRDCTPDHRLSRQGVVYLQIRNLADLSGWQLGCGVQDGEWYSIDGIFHGRRFSLYSSNATSCLDGGSRLVRKLLSYFSRH